MAILHTQIQTQMAAIAARARSEPVVLHAGHAGADGEGERARGAAGAVQHEADLAAVVRAREARRARAGPLPLPLDGNHGAALMAFPRDFGSPQLRVLDRFNHRYAHHFHATYLNQLKK